MYLTDSLSCQGPKTLSPGKVYKGTLPIGIAQRKEVLQGHTHTHTHTHTQAQSHAYSDMFTVRVSSCYLHPPQV